MNTALNYDTPRAYDLARDLNDLSSSVDLHRAMPNEPAREDLLLRKLGARGWGRIHHFRHYYNQGWSENARPPLSPRALEAFFRFLERIQFPAGMLPSVFMTDASGLELSWEDQSGQAVQVEFRSDGVEYYRAASNEEGEVSFDQLEELATRLSASGS
jgi:hypothetical protein